MFNCFIRFEVSRFSGSVYLVSTFGDANTGETIFVQTQFMFVDTEAANCVPFLEKCKANGMRIEVVDYREEEEFKYLESAD